MFERTKLTLLVVLVGLFAVKGFFDPDAASAIVGPYWHGILLDIGVAIILAVGLNLVNGYTGQFSLGHAGFMAVGAYVASAVSLGLHLPEIPYPDFAASGYGMGALKLPLWALSFVANGAFSVLNAGIAAAHALPGWGQFLGALLLGGVAAAVAGWCVGVPSLRLRGDYLAIVTLGFNEIIKVLLQNCEPLGAQIGLNGIPPQTNFFWTFAVAALAVYIVLNLVNSTFGRGFLAVRDDEVAAEAMGINTTRYKVIAFVVGAALAGLAGGLFAHSKNHIDPEGFNFMKSVDIVVMVILGGMGSTAGVCVAAVLLTLLPEGLRYVSRLEALPIWLRQVAENRMILYSLLLIALMLLRPQGLFGGLPGRKAKKA
jgi:branched-chain amino acid transport system permease protein